MDMDNGYEHGWDTCDDGCCRVRGVLEAGYTQCRVQYQSLYTDLSLDLSEFARIKNITGS